MKEFKKILFSLLFIVGLIFPVGLAAAEDVLDPVCINSPDAALCQANSQTQTQDDNSIFGPNGILTKAAQLIAVAVGVASVIMIVVGGLQYVLASGDPSNVTNAKNTVLYAIIGLIVALLAQAIISFVLVRIN